MDKKYIDYAVEMTEKLLDIDSPTGFTGRAAKWVFDEFTALGYEAKMTAKGGVIVDLGGRDYSDARLLEAHIDTLGNIVAEIKANGRLRVDKLGGLHPHSIETENVRVYTRYNGVYEGTAQIVNPSVHVNGKFDAAERSYDTMEIVLDEDVKTAAETRALGVENGDIVCLETRFRVTKSGYIKSRFLDDKLSVGILFALAKYLKDEKKQPQYHTYAHITVYEEVGFGGCASVPEGVTEAVAIDMGCIGEGIRCTEKQVSICAKDASGPYHYDVVTKLVDAARREDADYVIDVYPHYGSDVEATLRGGWDIRHGLLGPGVYASHGYERSHVDAVDNTLKVLKGYLEV